MPAVTLYKERLGDKSYDTRVGTSSEHGLLRGGKRSFVHLRITKEL